MEWNPNANQIYVFQASNKKQMDSGAVSSIAAMTTFQGIMLCLLHSETKEQGKHSCYFVPYMMMSLCKQGEHS